MSLLLLSSCILLISQIHGAKFPSEIQKCAFGDTDCIKDQINVVIKEFPKGNAALSLASIDPILIDTLQIKQGGSSPINIVIDFKKAKWLGSSNMEFYEVKGFPEDIDKAHNSFRIRVPRLTLVGNYKVNGRVLVLPITGAGNSNLTIDGVDIVYNFTTSALMRNAKTYMNISEHDIDFTITRFYMYFDNLFNGDKALTDNMNQFLNDNWEDLFRELKPRIVEAFGEIATQILGNVFARRPYKDFFLLPSPAKT